MMKLLVLLLIVAFVSIMLITTDAITPSAHAGSACDIAKAFGWHNVQWNFLCAMELMFEYMFDSGEV